MADLTNYNFELPRPQRSAVEARPTDSVLTGLFQGGNEALQGLNSKVYNDRLDSEQDKEAGLNSIASGLFQVDQTANNVPQAAKTAVDTLNKTQTGESQGTLPTGTYAVQLQNLTSQVLQQHPGSAYNVMEYMKSNGHYAAMFPQLEAQQKAQAAQQDSLQRGADAQVAYYYTHGGTPDTDFSTAQISGQKMMLADAQLQHAKELADAARAQEGIDVEKSKLIQAEGEKAALQAVQGKVASIIDPMFSSYRALLAGTPDGQVDDFMQKGQPMLDNVAATVKANAHQALITAGYGDDNHFSAVDKEIDSQIAGIKLIASDRSGAMDRTLKDIQTKYKIDLATAAPTIAKYSSLMGTNWVAEQFGSLSMLSPDVQKQLSLELRNLSSNSDGAISLNNIISISKGNTTLKDYSPAEAATYIGGIVTGQKGSEKAILNDNATNIDHETYLNTTSNVLAAANDLGPGNSSKDLSNAAALVASQQTRQTLDRLVTDPATREYGQSVGLASHLAAVKLLNDFKTNSGQQIPTGQSVVFDNASGMFKVQIEKGSVSDIQKIRPGTDLLARAQTMNNLLDHAVKTGKYDVDIPKSVSPLQLRQAIANGTPIKALKGDEKSPEMQYQNAKENLFNTLQMFPSRAIQ